jgi:deoxyribonuclease (pyrimidine dimer)
LLAFHREAVRLPNTINSGKAKLDGNYPKVYTLGTGHCKFFYNKLKWLHRAYNDAYEECKARGFNVTYMWPESVPMKLYNDWEVIQEAIDINRKRIADRIPVNARFTKRKE